MTKKLFLYSAFCFVSLLVCEQDTFANGQIGNSTGSNTAQAASAQNSQINVKEIVANAEKGDAKAQLALGSFYLLGQNEFPKSTKEAMLWIGKSAAQNFVPAQVYLGVLYGNGALGKVDFNQAQYWRDLAAKNGDAQEKWSVGNAYFFGYLLPKDINKAVYWIELAAQENHPDALVKILDIYKRNGDDEKYQYWIKRFTQLEVVAAKHGNAAAMNAIANKYLKGKDGLQRNIAQGVYWHTMADEKGDLNSTETLAKMYARGKYVSKKPEKARELFMKIVEKQPSYALKISNLYAEGKDGFPKDENMAFYWLERAAEKMDDTTKLYIAWRYWSGTHAPKNIERAVHWCGQCTSMKDSAERMKNDIQQGKPAPQNIMSYIKSNVGK